MRELLQDASTRKGTSRRNTSPQATRRARLSSCARCRTRNAAIRASTRPAPRSSRFARQTSGQFPRTVTPPVMAVAARKPSARASAQSADSKPGAATRKISKSSLDVIPSAYLEDVRTSTAFSPRLLAAAALTDRVPAPAAPLECARKRRRRLRYAARCYCAPHRATPYATPRPTTYQAAH